MRRLPFVVFASIVAVLTAACASEPEGSAPRKKKSNKGSEAQVLGSTGDITPEIDPTCASSSSVMRAEIDVIFLVDTSGSMDEETEQVKQNINNFAQSIGNTGLDYNVIMIGQRTKPSPIQLPPGVPQEGICVPPPLGGANCGDGPKFHHLDTIVGSTDSLQIILDKYPQYSGWLRPSAYKIFVEVTDDNSQLASEKFDEQLVAKFPLQFGDASARRYIFNSICGYKRNTPVLSAQACSTAVNTGDQYQKLSQLTGGTVDSVCETSYASVFENIAHGVVTKLGCDFVYPKAPAGLQTDPDSIVVTYTPGDGSGSRSLTRVTDESKCAANPDGWYYDDPANPTKILACPAMCSGPGSDTKGRLDVSVGCDAPPPK
ncbi:MAG TPA: vWA domain-containing protein [Labilithrix sp.]|nr:vWA domain-containing protein [Labilithrix sp.]